MFNLNFTICRLLVFVQTVHDLLDSLQAWGVLEPPFGDVPIDPVDKVVYAGHGLLELLKIALQAGDLGLNLFDLGDHFFDIIQHY